jgi:hypothetical protein
MRKFQRLEPRLNPKCTTNNYLSLLQIFNFYVDWKFKMATTAGKKWYKNILLEMYLKLFLSIYSLVWNVLLTNIGWYSNKTVGAFCQFEVQDGHHQDKCYIAYIFSSPGQRPGDLLPSLGIRRTSYTFTFKSSPLKPLNQIKPNLAGMVPWWIPFKIVSDSSAFHSRWLLLLKIEISSIVHCCFIINQNELKF